MTPLLRRFAGPPLATGGLMGNAGPHALSAPSPCTPTTTASGHCGEVKAQAGMAKPGGVGEEGDGPSPPSVGMADEEGVAGGAVGAVRVGVSSSGRSSGERRGWEGWVPPARGQGADRHYFETHHHKMFRH